MSAIYPEAVNAPVAPPAFKEGECAAQIIYLRATEPDITLAQAVGHVLKLSGGTVADVYQVWIEMEAERVRWRAVSPASFSTVTAFKAGLVAAGKKYLDETLWYDALKAEGDVTSYADLKAKFTAKEVVG